MGEQLNPAYHQLVGTAVGRLNKDTSGARCAVLKRAHAGLPQVHSVNRSSLLKIVVAELERMALEDAIQKVEVECRALAELSRGSARENFEIRPAAAPANRR